MSLTKPKRIGIDARFYGPLGKGLGRYTQEIVDRIIATDQTNEYVIFLGPDNFNELQTSSPRVKKVLITVRWYTLAEQFLMPYYIWKEKLDLVHFPHFNVPIFLPIKFIVTIHDLILTKFPTARATTLGPIKYKLKNLLYKIVIWSAVRRSKKIITVSEFTKKDIINYFKADPKKIIVTYEGVADFGNQKTTSRELVFDRGGEQGSRTPSQSLRTVRASSGSVSTGALLSSDRRKYKIHKPYLLYVGSAYPHKNLEGLIKIWPEVLKNNKVQLVLVGKEDYFYHRVKNYARELGLWFEDKNSPIIFAGYVSDEELKILYEQATAYIFPSKYEGFGLPPLEAMAHGCPVITSDKASMPEILGDAALYFNPEDEADMIKKINLILNDKKLREDLKKRGLEQVKKYNWEECAWETAEVYGVET
jgi:glycosyltransferase involved in cell wall biosynthesis